MTPHPLTPHPVAILLVEDNPGDVQLMREALREAFDETRARIALHVARDGREALAFLRREGVHVAAPRPGLILLDLNLPYLNGHEVLAAVKADPALRRIPVVMLTTSDAPADVCAAYDHHVNSFITKPVDLDRFFAVVKDLDDYWLSLVRLSPE